jgi:hypothetical protein
MEMNHLTKGQDPDLDRVFDCWIAFDKARFSSDSNESLSKRVKNPYPSSNAVVQRAWEALTISSNLRALEKWASLEVMNPGARDLSIMALKYCRAAHLRS